MTHNNYSLQSFPQPTTKRRVDMAGADFYPTPAWATRALVENETFQGTVLEPACGDGSMSKILDYHGLNVSSYDLYDRGYGRPGHDFLKSTEVFDNIITNPPYNLAGDFVLHALGMSRNKVAFLLRLAFLESAQRQQEIFLKTPLARVWIFSERVTFYPKGEERASGGTTAYAWFVWDHSYEGSPEIRWLPLGMKPNSRNSFKATKGKRLTLSDLQ